MPLSPFKYGILKTPSSISTDWYQYSYLKLGILEMNPAQFGSSFLAIICHILCIYFLLLERLYLVGAGMVHGNSETVDFGGKEWVGRGVLITRVWARDEVQFEN